MGLLDDAIREHLELKRRRGADPGEVAREQREALAPVPRDEHSGVDGGTAVAEDVVAEPVGAGNADVVSADDGGSAPVRAEPLADDLDVAPTRASDTPVIQETAELDMQTVLNEREDQAVPEAGAPDEESLEWEVPREAALERPAAVRQDAHAAAEDADAAESDEDVLEETPDFLRDTPEQDRLWFEQRPPRDFDFDK